jgi:mannose-6-phosphate isomerase-like protein (cupin superfamily)
MPSLANAGMSARSGARGQSDAMDCTVEHVGLVLSGTATAAFEDDSVVELRSGQLFYVPADPHDSWVVGD